MNMIAFAIQAAERTPIPDTITLAGIDFLCGRTRRRLETVPEQAEIDFARSMGNFPVAVHTDAANDQHYELPAEFFSLFLGAQRKYSSCLYPAASTTLDEAETIALKETADHAEIRDGQTILELGCGWGSLSLFLAANYPNARITSVSNSSSQRAYIEGLASARGITNLTVITADMNVFQTESRFDRIVSVEMFEHMSNWEALLRRAHGWLKPDGRMFLHVFTHKSRSYRFDHSDPADWIAQHFFTGGIMPAHDLPKRFPSLFTVEKEWRWNGRHYRRTALDWLKNFDANQTEIDRILNYVYGKDAALWRRRWRMFFLATAGLFGHADGEVWGVGHYLLKPVAAGEQARG
ncbi:SAM-dependent methyltransferase [Gellertiella hungarica]|uniref:Cyclopropane-fatty-acyl-phospholipid synthase n=1 Tax=Gellertiella hungarica TaxID=1572859 RepID=A0A7W6J9D5_9HYPH|nr:cyclopropane-fatty-acyl-phospholipid synthase family protein [Gellertiella hungarica]MBB4067219.1 cyclopropane-fatty-acyl-phospholipid synthase [Gellertiella hungarica]